jgi:hypothetical protein
MSCYRVSFAFYLYMLCTDQVALAQSHCHINFIIYILRGFEKSTFLNLISFIYQPIQIFGV